MTMVDREKRQRVNRLAEKGTLNIHYCVKCNGFLTSADDEMGACTQCESRLPRLRRLLLKVKAGYIDDPGTSDLDQEQPIRPNLTLADWYLARELLS